MRIVAGPVLAGILPALVDVNPAVGPVETFVAVTTEGAVLADAVTVLAARRTSAVIDLVTMHAYKEERTKPNV